MSVTFGGAALRRDFQQHHGFTTAVDPTIQKRLNAVRHSKLLRGITGQLLQTVTHGNTGGLRVQQPGGQHAPPTRAVVTAKPTSTVRRDSLRDPLGRGVASERVGTTRGEEREREDCRATTTVINQTCHSYPRSYQLVEQSGTLPPHRAAVRRRLGARQSRRSDVPIGRAR